MSEKILNIYFIRHGQTEWNRIFKLQGELDSPLTKEGIEQTIELRDTQLNFQIERVISSPLGRALDTSKILVGSNVEISIDENITEMNFGAVEGISKDEFKQQYPEEFYNLWHYADRYNPKSFGGETFESLEQRARLFLETIKLEKSVSNILVISHGMILKTIFGVIYGHNLSHFWNDPVPLNTSVTHVRLSDGEFRIVDFSNVSHLKNKNPISYL